MCNNEDRLKMSPVIGHSSFFLGQFCVVISRLFVDQSTLHNWPNPACTDWCQSNLEDTTSHSGAIASARLVVRWHERSHTWRENVKDQNCQCCTVRHVWVACFAAALIFGRLGNEILRRDVIVQQLGLLHLLDAHNVECLFRVGSISHKSWLLSSGLSI